MVEADAAPGGSTALSAGLIPAAGTRAQAAAGIDDAPTASPPTSRRRRTARTPRAGDGAGAGAGPAIDWLADRHDLGYARRQLRLSRSLPPAHARPAQPFGAGAGRWAAHRVRGAGIDIVCNRRAATLNEGRTVAGWRAVPHGGIETLGCDRLVLACNGFGGNRAMVARTRPRSRTHCGSGTRATPARQWAGGGRSARAPATLAPTRVTATSRIRTAS